MKRLGYFLAAIILMVGLIAMIGCGSGTPAKATTPAEVVDKAKIGMTGLEVIEVVDQEYFIRNDAFAVADFSKLEVVGDSLDYEAVKGMDSPYYGWLLFGVIVQHLGWMSENSLSLSSCES